MKDPILKEEFHTNCKKTNKQTNRNLLCNVMKKRKQAYCNKYFETDWNDIKVTSSTKR